MNQTDLKLPPQVITSNCTGPCFLWWVIYHFLLLPASFFLRRSISSLSFFISLSRPSVLVPRPEPWRDCTACVDSGNINIKDRKQEDISDDIQKWITINLKEKNQSDKLQFASYRTFRVLSHIQCSFCLNPTLVPFPPCCSLFSGTFGQVRMQQLQAAKNEANWAVGQNCSIAETQTLCPRPLTCSGDSF